MRQFETRKIISTENKMEECVVYYTAVADLARITETGTRMRRILHAYTKSFRIIRCRSTKAKWHTGEH